MRVVRRECRPGSLTRLRDVDAHAFVVLASPVRHVGLADVDGDWFATRPPRECEAFHPSGIQRLLDAFQYPRVEEIVMKTPEGNLYGRNIHGFTFLSCVVSFDSLSVQSSCGKR